jgi:hypothetical protein
MNTKPTPTRIFRSELQKRFQFTDEDLRANRQGQLTDAQIAHLRQEAAGRVTPVLVIIGGLGVLTLLSVPVTGSEFVAFLLVLGIPAALALATTIGLTEAAITPKVVTKVSGQAHFSYGIGTYDPPLGEQQAKMLRRMWWMFQNHTYRFAVSDIEFVLSRDEQQTLAAGLYNVYYVPTIRRIVALDVIDLDPTAPKRDALSAPADAPANVPVTYADYDGQDRDETDLRG